MTRVEINPNLRLDGVYTMADLDKDVHGPAEEFQQVDVYESTSGLTGRGWIMQVNEDDRGVKIMVEWSSLKIATTT